MKRFSEEHEWVEVKGEVATVGLTAHAASELGDITFIELPTVGAVFAQGDVLCVVESVKAASDVFIPIGGTVVEVNTKLESEPERINDSPEKAGWICRLSEFDEAELESLLSEQEYEQFVAEEDED